MDQNGLEAIREFGKIVTDAIEAAPEGYKVRITGTPDPGYMETGYTTVEVIPNDQKFS